MRAASDRRYTVSQRGRVDDTVTATLHIDG